MSRTSPVFSTRPHIFSPLPTSAQLFLIFLTSSRLTQSRLVSPLILFSTLLYSMLALLQLHSSFALALVYSTQFCFATLLYSSSTLLQLYSTLHYSTSFYSTQSLLWLYSTLLQPYSTLTLLFYSILLCSTPLYPCHGLKTSLARPAMTSQVDLRLLGSCC